MKLLITLVGLCFCNILLGQIKIGDNPQNIDASSVLELESNTRVLVITRISEAEMNNLTPLPGALVYNTDAQCVHFYDGNTWLNLCEALGLSLTADPIINPTPTIVITETGSNFNFEVGEIRGQNIVDFSIGGIDIQNNSITEDKLAPDSVGSEELRDNTVADDEIDYNQVTLADFTNDAGYITGAEIVSSAANNSITNLGGAFYDDTALVTNIAANAAAIAADGDTDSTNEIQDLLLAGNDLTISGSNTVDLSIFNNAGSDDQNLTGASLSAANILQIDIEDGTPAIVDLSALAGTGTDDQNLLGASLSPANVLQIEIEDGNPATVDLSSLAGTGTDDQDLLGASLSPANVLQIEIEDGNPATVDLSSLAGTGTDDQDLTAATLTGTTLQIDIEGGASTSVDLSPLAGGSTELADQITIVGTGAPGDEFEVNDGSINSTKITDGTVATIDLANDGVTTAKILDSNVTPAKIAAGNPGQFLNTNAGGVVVWADVPPSDDNQTAGEVPFAPTGNTVSADVQAAIEELQTEIDGISAGGAANPNDELQNLTLTGNILSLTPPATPSTPVDLSFLINDPDADPANELQNITSGDGSVTITPIGNDFDLSIPAGSDDQNLTAATLVGTDLTIDIEDGLSATADLSALATDAELAALPIDDADADPTNEIQTITSTDGSVTLVQTGDDYDLSVAGGSTDDQNLTAATLVGTDLTIDIEDGLSTTADLSALATDAELAALPIDDADADPANEIQTITSTDGSVTLVQTGDDYDLSVAGGSTDDQNLSGATLVGTDLTIDIEDGLSATADLSALATDAELAALPIDDADADPANEIQTITSTDGSVTLVQTGDDYDLSVAGGSIPTGTLGSIFYSDGAGGLLENNTALFWDSTNDRLGVGTNNPDRALEVIGETRSTSFASSGGTENLPAYSFYTNSDFDTGMFRAAADQLAFSTGGNEALRIDAGQNVGIGVLAPLANLHVNGDVRADGGFFSADTTIDVPDYVFQRYFTGRSSINESYVFNDLKELEAFIRKYHHLPGIPSVKAVKESGVWDITTATTNNLEKIEELFLHTIEQEKKISTLKEENEKLNTEMENLKRQIQEIKQMLEDK